MESSSSLLKTAQSQVHVGGHLRAIKPTEDIFNHNEQRIKEDIVRMIAQYLNDEGYVASKMTILDEANIKLQEREEKMVDIKRLKKAILEGDWPEVDRICAKPIIKNQKAFLYEVYKQQYLEYIEHHEIQKAFTHLQKRLKPLEHLQKTPNEFKDLCYLLTAKSLHDTSSFKNWEGIMGTRDKLVEQFQNMVDFENSDREGAVYVPPQRLLSLLRQAVAYQIEFSRYHPQIAPKITTQVELLQDYSSFILPNEVRHTFVGHTGNVKCAEFVGEQGLTLLSGSSDNTARIWNTETAEWIGSLVGHTSRIWDVSSSKLGDTVATASGDGTVKIWDMKHSKMQCLSTLDNGPQTKTGDVYTVQYHPTGKYLATGSYDKVVRLYDVEKNTVIKTFSGHSLCVSKCIFSPLGNLIVSGSKDNTIKFWDIVSGLCIKTISSHLGEVTSVEMNSNGTQLLSSSKDNSNRLWDVRMVKPIRRFKGHQNTFKNFIRAGFAGDAFVVGGSEDGVVYIWDTEKGDVLQRLYSHQGIVYSASWNAKQSLFCSCSDDKTIKTWWFNDKKALYDQERQALGNYEKQPHKEIQTLAVIWQSMVMTCTVISLVFWVISISILPKNMNSQPRHSVSSAPIAPVARRQFYSYQLHNVTLVDHYAWIKNSTLDQEEILNYIRQENIYSLEMMSPLTELQQQLISELEQGEWSSVEKEAAVKWNLTGKHPTRLLSVEYNVKSSSICGTISTGIPNLFWIQKPYFYWQAIKPGKFPIYMRRKMQPTNPDCRCIVPYFDMDSKEETVLDYNLLLPKNVTYFAEGVFEVNPSDASLLAFSFDLTGTEAFDLYFMNISSQSLLRTYAVKSTYYSVRWHSRGDDEEWLYYNVVDAQLAIPNVVYKTCIAGCASVDSWPVYKEEDASFIVEIDETMNRELLLIKIVGQITSEVHIISKTSDLPRLVYPRQTGVFYDIEHHGDHVYVRTNQDGADNYEIRRFHQHRTPEDYETSVTSSNDTLITKMEIYRHHLVLWIWRNGLPQVSIKSFAKSFSSRLFDDEYILSFHDPHNPKTQVYSVYPGTRTSMEQRQYREYDSHCLTFSNSSFIHPVSPFNFDMISKQSYGIEKQQPRLRDLVQERVWVKSLANDSVCIPISLVYMEKQDSIPTIRPVLLTAYGAYGGFNQPSFDPSLLPLLKRGILYAICHPRGDADLGSKWYQDGKYERKVNTLLDVGACMKGLVDLGYTLPKMIAVRGRSAGGLVSGAASNWFGTSFDSEDAFDLVKAVVAEVPFLNVIADTIDSRVCWTPFEYYEWGSPTENKTIFESMLFYSPYENIDRKKTLKNITQELPFNTVPLERDEKREFPSMFVSGGLYDTRVAFWESVQYVAKMRFYKNNNPNDRLRHSTKGTPLLLRIYPHGHYASSSQLVVETAEWMSFLLTELVG